MNFLAPLALSALSLFSPGDVALQTFPEPVDAVSVTFTSSDETGEIRYAQGSTWSEWQELHIENEQDPTLLESNLILFPSAVTKVQLRGDITAIHPIDIPDTPVTYNVAALSDPGTPRILSREEWGADETLRYSNRSSSSSSSSSTPEVPSDTGSGEPSQRVQDCEDAQLNYPNEFKSTGRTTKTEDGHTLLWPHTYSRSVNLLVVHHTAMKVDGDTRSGVERMRAIYAYHAANRGWGDVGYHYLVDEDGQIYEGKAGGKFVVAGHAYCNNIGTIGIALLGNFDVEQPTQKQLKALQWLLADLSETYDIDPSKEVTFHGKTMMPIVGHRDLLSTDCPGYYVYGAMAQIRSHVAQGEVDASVKLPKMFATTSKSSSSKKSTRITQSYTSSSTGTPRRVARLLETEASKLLRRKLGSNPGKETEAGVTARRTARLSGSSVSRLSRSSVSRTSSFSRSSTSSSSSRSSKPSKSSTPTTSSNLIRIRLVSRENGAPDCSDYNLASLESSYRGSLECLEIDGKAAIINELSLDDYMLGLAEEPDTEPYEKQRAFAIAARTYAAWYLDPTHRKFPGMPYDGSDSPATFQKYNGKSFEKNNPHWLDAVRDTADMVLTYNGELIKPPYFSSNDGRTRTPKEAGWGNFPFAQIFASKEDPWCVGMELRGHGVGMSGCGAKGQANEGRTGEEILRYYYPGTATTKL